MKAEVLKYRLESFLYPAQVSRIELESGTAPWPEIRRRLHSLADERKEQVMVYVYNNHFRRWEYIGKALPGGVWYTCNGYGPYVLAADGISYQLKEGGAA